MSTITEMSRATGVTIETGWDQDLEVPVLTGVQRQGDVIVVPVTHSRLSTPQTAVPSQGTPVVRGEAGGNTHAIYADGPGVLCDTFPASATSLKVAALVVPEGSVAYLGHPEHAYNGIGPGSYEIRRQREMADELRMVTD